MSQRLLAIRRDPKVVMSALIIDWKIFPL